MPRFTDSSSRKLVKLFFVDEFQIQDDLTELQKRIDRLQLEYRLSFGTSNDVEDQDLGDECLSPEFAVDKEPSGPAANTRSRRANCKCCYKSHCDLSFHMMGPSSRAYLGVKSDVVSSVYESFPMEKLNECEDLEFADQMAVTEDYLFSFLTSLNLVL